MLGALRTSLRAKSQVLRAGSATFRTTALSRQEGQDSHDDFRPQLKDGPLPTVSEMIEQDLKDNKVMLYMKGDPEAPMCGFSNAACRILDAYRVQYGSRNVLADPELRDGIKRFSEWPTIPQVYVNGEFIGGSDLLMEMHQKGELEAILHPPQSS